MSYGGPPQQPPYGGGYPPQNQGGYGQQYPQQQGNWGPPPPQQHGNWGPPPGGPPPGGPPPQQGGWGPPPGGPPPQHGGWGPPPGGPPPQQGGWGPPPGAPPQWQQGPPQQHGGYPPQQGGYGPPAQPSPGYDPRAMAQGDASRDADALRAAMKGFGTDEKALIRILSKPDPLQIALLRNTYNTRLRRNLEADIKSETSKYFCDGLVAIVQGPLGHDVHEVNRSIKGIGTKESVLNDVLIGRSNADMRAIKQAYQETFRKSLESEVKGDLSMKTEQLFGLIMAATRAEESTPIDHNQIDRDTQDLHRAMDARIGTDQMTVCSILSQRSDGQVRAIAHHWKQKYHSDMEKVVDSEFSGHMKDALLLMVRRATDRAMSDAVQLEEAMAGMGTKDNLLVARIVRLHWNRQHMDQVKRAYQHRFKKDLIQRVKGEISGDYENLMVACLT